MKKLVLAAVLLTAISNIDAAAYGFDWASFMPSKESIVTGAQNFGARCYQWASASPWKATALGVGVGGLGLGLYGYWYTRPEQALRRWLTSSLEFFSKISDAEFSANLAKITTDTPGMSLKLLDTVLAPFESELYNPLTSEQAQSYDPKVVDAARDRVKALENKRDELYPKNVSSAQ